VKDHLRRLTWPTAKCHNTLPPNIPIAKKASLTNSFSYQAQPSFASPAPLSKHLLQPHYPDKIPAVHDRKLSHRQQTTIGCKCSQQSEVVFAIGAHDHSGWRYQSHGHVAMISHYGERACLRGTLSRGSVYKDLGSSAANVRVRIPLFVALFDSRLRYLWSSAPPSVPALAAKAWDGHHDLLFRVTAHTELLSSGDLHSHEFLHAASNVFETCGDIGVPHRAGRNCSSGIASPCTPGSRRQSH
jgi:hypothetical protein